MAKKTYIQMSFATQFVESRKIKDDFFCNINKIVDWEKIGRLLEKYYCKGDSVVGRKAYPALLLFKMVLLQTWYGLSDYEAETLVNDRLSFMKFCGLNLEDDVPDHSVIARFRKVLIQNKVMDKLLKLVIKQLKRKSIVVKRGVILDASVTPTPRKPKTKPPIELLENSAHETQKVSKISKASHNKSLTKSKKKAKSSKLAKKFKPGVDQEGSWTKKAGKYMYGYKKHYLVDKKTSIVLTVVTSTASAHDSQFLEQCVSQSGIPPGSEVLTDKGYYGKPNGEVLKKLGLKDRRQSRATRGNPLTYWEKQRNKLIGKDRYKVERVFGGIKKWFKSGVCRYVGHEKTHYQHTLEALAYNLKIAPGIVMSNAIR